MMSVQKLFFSQFWKFLLWPIFRLQQSDYAKALIFRQQKEHNSKLSKIRKFWHDNPVAQKLRLFASKAQNLDLRQEPNRALSSLEAALSEIDFGTASRLKGLFELQIELMIEFHSNLVIDTLVETHAGSRALIADLINRDTTAIEQDLEAEAKAIVTELASELESITMVKDALKVFLPELRQATTPSVIKNAVLKFLSGVARFVGDTKADQSDDLLTGIAFQWGGQKLSEVLDGLRYKLHQSKVEEALNEFIRLVCWLEGSCDSFMRRSEQRFEPIMKSFVVYEKRFQEQVIIAIQRVAKSEYALKPVFVKLYGKLSY